MEENTPLTDKKSYKSLSLDHKPGSQHTPKSILVLQKGTSHIHLQPLPSDLESLYHITFGDEQTMQFRTGKFREIRWSDEEENHLIFSYKAGRYYDHRVDMYVDNSPDYSLKLKKFLSTAIQSKESLLVD